MEEKDTKSIRKPLPVIPLRGTVVFPGTITPILVGRERSINALEFASAEDRKIFLVTQREPGIDEPVASNLFRIGTVARVIQVMRFPSGILKALVEGETRARVIRYNSVRSFMEAVVQPSRPSGSISDPEIQALLRKSKELFGEYVNLSQNLPEELAKLLAHNRNANEIADVISAQLQLDFRKKQELLRMPRLLMQLELLVDILVQEVNVLRYKSQLENKVQQMMDDGQKEYFLRQQLEVIHSELGDDAANYESELQELEESIEKAHVPEKVKEALRKDFKRLSRTPITSPESAVSRTYIEWLLELPWFVSTKDRADIRQAEEILEKEHHGLEKIKERILEHIAVMNLSKSAKGPILCLVGPPGVGKTSIARSVSHALDRKFIRASLGGLHDEAEIRGHRRTYVGALPGRIIQGIRRAGSNNPVFLLDEVDKIGADFHGDPAAALMEVLDPDQNNSFMDNYIELPFDLSHVLFITTANTADGIPLPLMDRMEILRIPGYLESEKFIIARDYLLPKQLELIPGLKRINIDFIDDAFLRIIREYTLEAGVRELERKIAAILRKIAVKISKNRRRKKFHIDSNAVREYIGVPKFVDSPVPKNPLPGEALGLAWTSVGGQLLHIEVLLAPGKGEAKFTGSLGDVMKESVQAAMSFVRSMAKGMGIDGDKLRKQDVHVHFPEGAVPKDGPSAGIAIVMALASAVMKKPLSNDIAFTGEITLAGRILPIGGLPEKLHAAKRFGLKRVVIPKGNEKDLVDIKREVLEGLEIIPLSKIEKVIEVAFSNK